MDLYFPGEVMDQRDQKVTPNIVKIKVTIDLEDTFRGICDKVSKISNNAYENMQT
jgi:hypothetical protein